MVDAIRAVGGGAMALLGVALAARYVYRYLTVGRAQLDRYEPVEAVVERSELGRRGGRVGGDVRRRPEIRYRYRVDDREYLNGRVYPGPAQESRDEGAERAVVEDHPEGATVTAYYDPEDPAESYLVRAEERAETGYAVGVVVGVLFVIFGAAILATALVG